MQTLWYKYQYQYFLENTVIHIQKSSLSQARYCIWPHFESKGVSNSEMGYNRMKSYFVLPEMKKLRLEKLTPYIVSGTTPIPHLMWLTLVNLCKTLPSFWKAKVTTHWTKVLNILLCSETQADANKPQSALPFPGLPTPREFYVGQHQADMYWSGQDAFNCKWPDCLMCQLANKPEEGWQRIRVN